MKILLATDGSENGLAAARFLASLGHLEDAEITLLTVSYLPENLHSRTVASWYSEWQTAENSRIDLHHKEVEAILDPVRGKVTRCTKAGNPTHIILTLASELDSDLIVLGARGHGRLERLLIGSVSDAVATHAPCSVVVVRPPRVIEGAASDPPEHRVLLGYDGSPSAKQALAEFKRFDWQGDTALILSVHQVFDGFGQDYAELYELQSELPSPSELSSEASKLVAGTSAGINCVEADGTHIGHTLSQEANRHKSDLIMVGDNGHGMLEQFLLGSTSKYVLRHSDCSVWIARCKAERAKSAESTKQAYAPNDSLNPTLASA